MKYKVAQIVPYFGKWPEWIELYFFSCGRNPMVDFIFYTDCPLPKHQYKNTIFHQCTFEEYKKLVGERLGIDYSIKKAYKLTDLKPFLGAVHKYELKSYDFWGFGDLDLVYGDLCMMINNKKLSKYDLITSHSYRVAGHFTIVRNNESYRNLCFKIKNWKEGLVEDQHHGFDEMDWSDLINPFGRNLGRIYRYIFQHLSVSLYHFYDVANRFLLRKKYMKEYYTTPNPTLPEGTSPIWTYENKSGKIIDPQGRVLPYLHFMCFKKNIWIDTKEYWMNGFYQLDEQFEKYEKIIFDKNRIFGV